MSVNKNGLGCYCGKSDDTTKQQPRYSLGTLVMFRRHKRGGSDNKYFNRLGHVTKVERVNDLLVKYTVRFLAVPPFLPERIGEGYWEDMETHAFPYHLGQFSSVCQKGHCDLISYEEAVASQEKERVEGGEELPAPAGNVVHLRWPK